MPQKKRTSFYNLFLHASYNISKCYYTCIYFLSNLQAFSSLQSHLLVAVTSLLTFWFLRCKGGTRLSRFCRFRGICRIRGNRIQPWNLRVLVSKVWPWWIIRGLRYRRWWSRLAVQSVGKTGMKLICWVPLIMNCLTPRTVGFDTSTEPGQLMHVYCLARLYIAGC